MNPHFRLCGYAAVAAVLSLGAMACTENEKRARAELDMAPVVFEQIGKSNSSSMAVMRDKETGCEYIVRASGGVIPRMDGTKHKGCRS